MPSTRWHKGGLGKTFAVPGTFAAWECAKAPTDTKAMADAGSPACPDKVSSVKSRRPGSPSETQDAASAYPKLLEFSTLLALKYLSVALEECFFPTLEEIKRERRRVGVIYASIYTHIWTSFKKLK